MIDLNGDRIRKDTQEPGQRLSSAIIVRIAALIIDAHLSKVQAVRVLIDPRTFKENCRARQAMPYDLFDFDD